MRSAGPPLPETEAAWHPASGPMGEQAGDAGKEDGGVVDASGIRSVQRAIDVLALFEADRSSLSLRDIVSGTGLPKTTVIRLLQTLGAAGVVWSAQGGDVVVGPRLLRWARLAAQSWRIPPAAQKTMASLAMTCSETVNLYVRSHSFRFCVAQEQGPQMIRQVVRVGSPMPLWAGAASKVLLCDSVPGDVARIAAMSGGRVSPTELTASIETAKRNGFAVSHGEREQGASSVSVPIPRADGRSSAALTISGPSSRFSADRINTWVPLMKKAAAEMAGAGVQLPLIGLK